MRRFAVLGPALVVCVLTSGISGAAASGLNLGRTTTVRQGTTLKSKRGPTLTLVNTGSGVAARFNVLKGKPPFAVSSQLKVIGLNSDLLDGLDSAAFQLRVTGGCAAGSAIRVINANGSVTCVSTLSPTPPLSWNLSGNAGTNPATNFLGTTDAQPLVIRTNNAEALRVTADGNVGVGTTTPGARVDVAGGAGTAINGTSSAGNGVDGTSSAAIGVEGVSSTQAGVFGSSDSSDGIRGSSNSGTGINGLSDSGTAVSANSASGIGLTAHSGSQDGVVASSDSGNGVRATASSGAGMIATSTNADGVEGDTTNGNGLGGRSTTGRGVVGNTSHPAGGGAAAAVLGINTGGGDIFIGQVPTSSTDPTLKHVARIDSSGKGFFDGGTADSGADYAEAIPAPDASSLAPGDVLAIDPREGNHVTLADSPNSQLVAGVYSTKPSVLAIGNRGIDSNLAGTVPVAMLGVVPTKVSAENGAIRTGDLLTTAGTPGYAMKARAVDVGGVAIYPTGTILGKALAPLASGRGTIEVLLMMR
jgi:hypothetical protein